MKSQFCDKNLWKVVMTFQTANLRKRQTSLKYLEQSVCRFFARFDSSCIKLKKTEKGVKVFKFSSSSEKFLEKGEDFNIEEKNLEIDDCQGGVPL